MFWYLNHPRTRIIRESHDLVPAGPTYRTNYALVSCFGNGPGSRWVSLGVVGKISCTSALHGNLRALTTPVCTVAMDQAEFGDEPESGHEGTGVQTPTSASAKKSRIYRACVHCRQRKSKCQLDAGSVPGMPPCRRCTREGRECVLAGSRRGGRRPKKNQQQPATPNLLSIPDEAGTEQDFNELSAHAKSPAGNNNWGPWEGDRGGDVHKGSISNGEAMDNTIDSAKIQNPSDALEILAHVAGGVHAESGDSDSSAYPAQVNQGLGLSDRFRAFKPYRDGKVSLEAIHNLFLR
jgi:hypothetical protein